MTKTVPEFSRFVEITDHILNVKWKLEATFEELQALAKRFDVIRIDNLYLEYMIISKHDILGAYELVASIKSRVIKYIIDETEESIDIDENFDVVLLTKDMAKNNYDALRECDIEIFNDDRRIDVGEIASQYLSLCIFM